MKFEYKLYYDFVSNKLSFEITEMPEDLRYIGGDSSIINITSSKDNEWSIMSYSVPEIIPSADYIYLRGTDRSSDNKRQTLTLDKDKAFEVADVLAKFQRWLEDNSRETVMTIAEIEEKLGIKNLKIVKEAK
jgi:hypothetical protein